MARRKKRYSTRKCPICKAFNPGGKIVNVYCGRWDCERCSKINSRMWAWRVRIHIESARGGAFFWTLTLGSKYEAAVDGYRALPRLWDTFRKMVQRIVGKWEYCAFVEGQPKRSGMPHFHIISLVKAPKRLKDMAMQAGFGYQAKEIAVTSSGAASYVAKYASKQDEAMPRDFRRVRTSRGWARLPTYHGMSLIVKARKEFLSEYLLRVAEITGVDLETLHARWTLAHEIDNEVDKP